MTETSNQNTQKVTYNYEQRSILMLKEAYQRDLVLFNKMLAEIPKDWTLTVMGKGRDRELIVNVPPKKK